MAPGWTAPGEDSQQACHLALPSGLALSWSWLGLQRQEVGKPGKSYPNRSRLQVGDSDPTAPARQGPASLPHNSSQLLLPWGLGTSRACCPAVCKALPSLCSALPSDLPLIQEACPTCRPQQPLTALQAACVIVFCSQGHSTLGSDTGQRAAPGAQPWKQRWPPGPLWLWKF